MDGCVIYTAENPRFVGYVQESVSGVMVLSVESSVRYLLFYLQCFF